MAVKHAGLPCTGPVRCKVLKSLALARQCPATRLMSCKSTTFVSCTPTYSMRAGPVLRPARLLHSTAGQRLRLAAPTRSLSAASAADAAMSIQTDPWTTLAVLSACAGASQLLESHTRWGSMLSAPLLALSAALAAAAVGLLPAVSPIYDAVWRFLMPLAVALYLLENDFSLLAKSGRQVLAAFMLGAGSMFAGGLVAWQLLGAAMGQHGAQLASCMLASYIGGSVNFAAVAAATHLPPALMPAAIAADNLAMLVLLAALMAVPLQRIGLMLQRQPKLAAAAAVAGKPTSSAPFPPFPAQQQPKTAAAAAPGQKRNKPSSRGALGLDGSPLMTQPPSAAAVAACMEATARGRTTTDTSGSSSNGSSSNSSKKAMQGGISTGGNPKQYSRSKAFGQLALDGGPLLTPDPSDGPAAGPTGGQPALTSSSSSSSNGKSSSNGNGNGNSSHASSSGRSSSSNGSSKCGGCRGSGVTALDENPLLTRAPGMGDAISVINAAREGKQQLLTPAPPGSKASSDSSSDGVVGCGCCDEALDAMAAAAGSLPQTSMAAAAVAAASSQVTGALALDGGLLMTEEPDSNRMAAAVAAAKSGSKSGSVSISSSALSSLASTDADELELVVKFDIKALQESLRKQKQQQQEFAEAAATAAAAAAKAAAAAEKQQVQVASSGSSSTLASGSGGVLTSSSAAAALAAASAALAASHAVSSWLGAPALQLLLLSGFALVLSVAGSAAHKQLLQRQQNSSRTSSAAAAAAAVASPFAGASALGQLLMGLFFATLGASCACPLASLVAAGPLMAFTIIMVLVHWGLMLGVGGVLFKLPINVLVAGSVANVGGPATAAGVVGGKGWGGLVQPSLLCGSLGYAVGTAGGLALARCLGVLA